MRLCSVRIKICDKERAKLLNLPKVTMANLCIRHEPRFANVFLTKILNLPIHQSFTSPKFCTIWYIIFVSIFVIAYRAFWEVYFFWWGMITLRTRNWRLAYTYRFDVTPTICIVLLTPTSLKCWQLLLTENSWRKGRKRQDSLLSIIPNTQYKGIR